MNLKYLGYFEYEGCTNGRATQESESIDYGYSQPAKPINMLILSE